MKSIRLALLLLAASLPLPALAAKQPNIQTQRQLKEVEAKKRQELRKQVVQARWTAMAKRA